MFAPRQPEILMNAINLKTCLIVVLVSVTSLAAQAFPEGSTTPMAAEVGTTVEGKTFSVNLRDGSAWRLDFRGKYIYVDTKAGQRTDGVWKAEDGKLCIQLKGRDMSCSDVRLHNGILHLLRPDGEVIQYLPR
jgi:hypothetical protein